MAQPKGGPKEAAKLLASLGLENKKKVMDIMQKKDPKMTELIKMSMVDFEDLKHMTPQMLQEFLKEVSIKDLSLALRLGSDDLKHYFLKSVSKSIRQEISDIIDGPPQQKKVVEEAHQKIMDLVREKVEKGQLVLKPEDDDVYV